MESRLEKKLQKGVTEAALSLAEKYRQLIGIQEPGPPFVTHSLPGQYPFRETGQGQENVLVEVGGAGSLSAAAGVTDESTGSGPVAGHRRPGGMHLYFLSINHRGPAPGHGNRERLFIDTTAIVEKRLLRRAFRRGAK